MDTSASVSEQQVQAIRSGGQLPEERPGPARVRLGEELPIFCERCGYSLHGLPQVRCEHCTVLQFHCPECGHHQAINTLRPAVQRALGQIRAWTLGLLVTFRIGYFLALLFAWAGMGAAWAYSYNYNSSARTVHFKQVELSSEMIAGFSIFGMSFGLVSRMFLLRWRRGAVIGLFLAGLIVTAAFIGAWLEYSTSWRYDTRPLPYSPNWLIGVAIGAIAVVIGATASWPLWAGLVKVFLPKRASEPLLAWQRSLSERPSDHALSELARDKVGPSSHDNGR